MDNPSPETLGYLALSALGDGIILTGAGSFLGAGIKALRASAKATKAAKALAVAPGRHVARRSAQRAIARRELKKGLTDLGKGATIEIGPQTVQTYNKYAE